MRILLKTLKKIYISISKAGSFLREIESYAESNNLNLMEL
ncbi:hypothetical protein PROCH_0821 [Prochlorococcus marinus str. EQPAC1]|nr:hypothetical protein PROCH_0821 [Prochlorococcus marinus str. EQPAC1]